MRRKLFRSASSLLLSIPKPIIRLLDLKEGDVVEVYATEDGKIIVEKVYRRLRR